MSSFFLNCVRTTAVFLAAVSIVSCGTESKEPASQLGLRPYYDFQYNLAPLTIGIRLFHPDYGFTPTIDVYEGSIRCDSQDILTQAGMLTLNNNSSCRDFTINLQYVSATNVCQPGGLYLMSATVTNPDDGQATSCQNMTLAGWDQHYNKVVPWITPFDTPILVSQASKSAERWLSCTLTTNLQKKQGLKIARSGRKNWSVRQAVTGTNSERRRG